MNKALLIIGPTCCGKTFLAHQLAKGYRTPLSLYKNVNTSEILKVSEIPDLIIIDDILIKNIEDFFNWITEGVHVRFLYNGGEKLITPDIIITHDGQLSDFPIGASFRERFNVINLQNDPDHGCLISP